MTPLGRGLASLIPQRSDKEVEEALEQIDTMEKEPEPEETGPPDKPKVTYLNPRDFESPVVDTVKKRTMLTIEQLPDDAPDMPLVRQKQKEEQFWTMPKTAPVEEPVAQASKSATHEEKVVQIPIENIQINPFQPRRAFDPAEMEELVASIDEHGILQPLVVRRVGKETYELIAGERRLRAAKQLGWEAVPCVVKVEVAGTEKSLVYALIENVQRENLNPMEEALAYERLNKEFGMTHEEIGKAMGSSRVRVTNSMRVLQLPAEIQHGLSEGKITAGHAKAILMIPDPEKQVRFYNHLVEEGLTVRKAEIRARRIQRAMKVDDPMRHKGRRGRHALSVKYRPYLEERFGFNADVKYIEQKNRYEVVFRAYSDGEVQDLIDRLLGNAALPKNLDQDVLDENEDVEDDEE